MGIRGDHIYIYIYIVGVVCDHNFCCCCCWVVSVVSWPGNNFMWYHALQVGSLTDLCFPSHALLPKSLQKMKMLHIRCCCCVLFICGNGSPLMQVTITTYFPSDPRRKKQHLSCANKPYNWFLDLIMNVIRDSSCSCVVCVWFEMLKMRLYKDDLMEINSKTNK
jgi:hypothetical protein